MDRDSDELQEQLQSWEAGAQPTLTDFYAYLPENKFIYRPTRQLWPAASVDGMVKPWPQVNGKGTKPSAVLQLHRAVQQVTWDPGSPEIVEGKLALEGGWIDKSGTRTFNLYVPAPALAGNPHDVGRW